MKKVLSLLTITSLLIGSSATIMSNSNATIIPQVKLKNNEIINNEKALPLESWVMGENEKSINLRKTTAASGTHTKTDSASVSTVGKNSFDAFKTVTNVNAYGLFYFHTYKDPVTFKNVAFKKDDSSTDTKLKFKYSDSHQAKDGWAVQDSRIAMTITITKAANGFASIKLDNYIYARTAGAFHSCSTTSNIDRLDFI